MFDGKQYKYKGKENSRYDAEGFGVATCVSDTKHTITGTFDYNKPRGFCKQQKLLDGY